MNRSESYHKLHKAVSYANFGKLRFKTEGEQQIWNECGRLIANCIIFYNATILSNVMRYQVENGDQASAISLERISPVAWQHINFYGRYEFTKSFQPIDMDAIVQELVACPGVIALTIGSMNNCVAIYGKDEITRGGTIFPIN